MFRFVYSFFYFSHKSIFLDIEEESCTTTYIQWVQTHSSKGETVITIVDSLPSSISNKDFECVQDQPGKFR
jgi:hypothetical protein